jgi:hypothetical protein
MSADYPSARKRTEAWIDRIKAAGADKAKWDVAIDADSLARAADLNYIYAEMSWVRDMPVSKPKRRGRRVDPKSREQFAKWVKQTYGWGSKQRLNQLQAAHELLPILSTAVDRIRPTGERCLRPLGRLRAQGYGAQQAQVWAAACEMADGECPTPAQVSRAVSEFLDRFKPTVNTAADPRTPAEKRAARRARLVAEFDAILSEDNALADATVKELIRHYNDHQKVLRAEKSA